MDAFKPRMALDKFDALLDKHGCNLDGWPAIEQESARELLKMSDDARYRLKEEQDLAHLLTSRQGPKAPRDLVGKIMQKARESS